MLTDACPLSVGEDHVCHRFTVQVVVDVVVLTAHEKVDWGQGIAQAENKTQIHTHTSGIE